VPAASPVPEASGLNGFRWFTVELIAIPKHDGNGTFWSYPKTDVILFTQAGRFLLCLAGGGTLTSIFGTFVKSIVVPRIWTRQ